jgi:hypothetical protein
MIGNNLNLSICRVKVDCQIGKFKITKQVMATYCHIDNTDVIENDYRRKLEIQGVSEISALILTRQKEQLFYLPFCRKTMFNSKKKLERFFTKIALRH